MGMWIAVLCIGHMALMDDLRARALAMAQALPGQTVPNIPVSSLSDKTY